FNDFGFSGGGPLYLPKIYNGKNKTFLFGAWERYNQTDLRFRQDATTVPTTAMLGGDFSALLDTSVSYGQDSAGNTIYRGAIFDPSTQNVFPGNIIPTNRISSQAKGVILLYQKYYRPNNTNVVNNFNSPLTDPPINKTTNLDLKLDQNFSDKNHFSTSFNYSDQPIVGLGDNGGGLWVSGSANPGPLNSAQMQHTITDNVRGIDTYTISPRLLNVVSVSYNEWWKGESDPSPVDNQALGFTAESGAVPNNFPIINFAGANNINETPIGNRFGYTFQYSRLHFSDNVSWVTGPHNLKFGGQLIFYNANSNAGSAGLVSYNFSNLTGVPQTLANNSQISPYIGFGFANFLLGEVASGSKGNGIDQHGLRKGMNLFMEDQIKITAKLTLNASLRWEANLPYHEANGRWSEFDLNAVNPTWSPYKGAYRYLSSGSQSFEVNNNFHQFGPHIGAAYEVTDKLVARGAWGLFYVPLGLNTWGATPYMGDFGYVGVDNAPSAAVNMPSFNWDQNIYPGVQVPPVRDPSANQVRVLGPEYIDPNTLSLGWTQNWNLGVQYEFGKNAVLAVNYIGNIGRHLRAGYLDPRNYPTWGAYGPLLQSGHVSDSIYTQTDAQNAGVPWLPWAVTENFIGGGSSGYYPAYAAINPYPQVAAGQGPILFNDSPLGSSAYKAMVVEVSKRRGALVANLNYTFSRATGNVNNAPWAGGNMMDNWVVNSGYQDPSAYRSFDNLVSNTDIAHQVKGYLTYELPFGRGKKWLPGVGEVLDAVVGGWRLGTMVGYQSGFPITAVASSWGGYPGMSSSFANYNRSVPLSRTFKSLDLANLSDPSNLYVNPQAFSDPTYGTLGNQMPVWSSWRGWGYSNEDLSILKNFGIGKDER